MRQKKGGIRKSLARSGFGGKIISKAGFLPVVGVSARKVSQEWRMWGGVAGIVATGDVEGNGGGGEGRTVRQEVSPARKTSQGGK